VLRRIQLHTRIIFCCIFSCQNKITDKFSFSCDSNNMTCRIPVQSTVHGFSSSSLRDLVRHYTDFSTALQLAFFVEYFTVYITAGDIYILFSVLFRIRKQSNSLTTEVVEKPNKKGLLDVSELCLAQF
jgi:hypothetical protein